MTPETDRSTSARSRDVVRKVLQLLAAVTARLRTPLLVVALAPVIPAALLLILGLAGGSAYLTFAVICAVIGLIPAVWLFVRREQLTAAPQPPEDAAVEILAAMRPTILDELRANLVTITQQRRRIGPLRQVWRGIRLSKDFKDHFTEIPRLRPFLPSRLRGLVFLAGACLASAVGLLVLAIVAWLVSEVGLW